MKSDHALHEGRGPCSGLPAFPGRDFTTVVSIFIQQKLGTVATCVEKRNFYLSFKESGIKILIIYLDSGHLFLLLASAREQRIDVVLVDTAGRMQDNEPLMRALSKVSCILFNWCPVLFRALCSVTMYMVTWRGFMANSNATIINEKIIARKSNFSIR